MRKLWKYLFNYRLRALIKKELAQTRHDRKLMFSLTVLPVVQLTLVGFALSAAVTNVRLAIVDDSRTPESRELIATLTESKSFRLAGYYSSVNQLGDAVSQGKADAGMVVPYDYARDLLRDRQTTLQFLLNATNANTATISRGYAESMIQRFNAGLRGRGFMSARSRLPDRISPAVVRCSLNRRFSTTLVWSIRGLSSPVSSGCC
jgi:ABC-2 type transport system permease protein